MFVYTLFTTKLLLLVGGQTELKHKTNCRLLNIVIVEEIYYVSETNYVDKVENNAILTDGKGSRMQNVDRKIELGHTGADLP